MAIISNFYHHGQTPTICFLAQSLPYFLKGNNSFLFDFIGLFLVLYWLLNLATDMQRVFRVNFVNLRKPSGIKLLVKDGQRQNGFSRGGNRQQPPAQSGSIDNRKPAINKMLVAGLISDLTWEKVSVDKLPAHNRGADRSALVGR